MGRTALLWKTNSPAPRSGGRAISTLRMPGGASPSRAVAAAAACSSAEAGLAVTLPERVASRSSRNGTEVSLLMLRNSTAGEHGL